MRDEKVGIGAEDEKSVEAWVASDRVRLLVIHEVIMHR